MADSQAQPSWLQGLMQGLLGKMGLAGAASQGGTSTPDPRAAQNPWVAPVPGGGTTANPPGTDTSYLKGIIDAQMQMQKNKKAPTKPSAPSSSLTDLFQSLVGNL